MDNRFSSNLMERGVFFYEKTILLDTEDASHKAIVLGPDKKWAIIAKRLFDPLIPVVSVAKALFSILSHGLIVIREQKAVIL